MSRRPVVGIVGHGYVVPRPFGDLPVTGSPTGYVDGLADVGARPVVLPGVLATDLLDVVDALVLTGGGDVDPELYGGDSAGARDVDRRRDDAEIALVRAAAERRVPLLGVCRGHQVLAVAFGGTLVGGLDHIHPGAGHAVRTDPDSLVGRLLGPEPHTSALHHQAVSDPGPCWRATAWAADGIVEAVEWRAGDWPALGVQWHPELPDGTGAALFGWLRDAAAIRAGGAIAVP
jgi:putative glutamine amidotransferase